MAGSTSRGNNRALAGILHQMASALELQGANRFRVNAHSKGARQLEDMGEDVAQVADLDDPAKAGDEERAAAVKRLTELPGIGKGLAEKIVEYLGTGKVEEHERLLEEVPEGLFDLLEVPGLGPKAVKLLWEELGITTVDELKANLDSPELAALPRMGAKSIDNIRRAIEFSESAGERVPLGLARPLALELQQRLEDVPGVQQVAFAGSLRRGRETIGDLDFLATGEDLEELREVFTTLPEVTQVLAKGETKCSVRLEAGEGGRKIAMQADLRTIDPAGWGAALLYFTGSKEHNVKLRERAVKARRRLNEYGLFEGTEERPQESGAELVAAATEEEIYRALELPFIPPELREDHGEVEDPPAEGALITLEDIRAELHAHTTASDGRLSIEELAEEARSRGFHTLAVTDHSQSQVIANGLSPERLEAHIEAVREADVKLDGIKILAGSEVDILSDGSLDYEDELLAKLDLVVASPHAGLRQEPEAATERLLAAIRHPLVHIVGHPTGRLVGRREGLSPDMSRLFDAAVEHDTALELNANWHRLDLKDSHLRAALARGVKIAIDTDAHDRPHFDFLVYGILTARRAGMRARDSINTWPADELHRWLAAKR